MGKEVWALFRYIDCIDLGSDYCPCSLAERGECIICSQLRDEEFCDCLNWKGTCVYQEFIWNNEKSKGSRQYREFKIVNRKYLRNDLLLMNIKVTKTLSRELNSIGAFVFLKRPEDGECFGTPISILNSDIYNNVITVVIKIDGVKTKSLKECSEDIMVKGPYWNGIQGRKYLTSIKEQSCLIVGRGVAIAPAVLAAKKLLLNKNEVYVLLDKGRSGQNFSKQYFLDMGCIVEDTIFLNRQKNISDLTKERIEQLHRKWNFKTVLSAGDDDFHKKIINYVDALDGYINIATVNNSTMCCGEGVCGSCMSRGAHNEKIKSCKQQYNPKEIFLKGMGK